MVIIYYIFLKEKYVVCQVWANLIISLLSIMENIQRNISLPQERYDRELYKQAVKAAKEAKELERRDRKRDKVRKILLSFVLLPVVVISGYFVLSLFKPKAEYTLANESPKARKYDFIEEEKETTPFSTATLSIPEISSQGAMVFNPVTGDVLYEKNVNEKRSIASLTKLMSAIIVLETFDLDDVITASRENIPEDMDWQLGVKEGDSITVENLLKSMLISSYNDSAYIIANAYPNGGYSAFIKAMNQKAKSLRMNSTTFSNPAGIDEEENFSTVKDVAILTSVVRKYPDILRIVKIGKEILNWGSSDGIASKEVFTTNQLYASTPYIKGLKTGITDLAGQCFVGYYVYPNGNEIVTIVVNSKNRFDETVLLEKYAREKL